MSWRVLRTIAIKDLKEVLQNKSAWMPAVFIPLIFIVLLPGAGILVPYLIGAPMQDLLSRQGPFGLLLQNMPPSLAAEIQGLTEMQTWVLLFAGYLFAPMFLILPLMLASIVGADSFVGEKERKTLEALLYTPTTDLELFLGKVLASVAPAIALTWASFAIYGVVVNAAAWPIMGHVWFPILTWWPIMLWLTPAIATLAMAVTVLISARVNTFMEAYQLTASLVVVVIALVAGQMTGLVFLSAGVAFLAGLALWILDAALIRFGVRRFARSELIARI